MKKINLLLTLTIVGCASTPDVEDYSLHDIGEKFQFKIGKASNGEQTADVVHIKDRHPWSSDEKLLALVKKTKNEEIPETIFGHYCKNGKQKRKLKTNVKAIISRPPVGIAKDQAQKIQDRKLEMVRHFVKSYFQLNVFGVDGAPDIGPTKLLVNNSIDLNVWENNKYTKTSTYTHKARLFALSAKNGEEYARHVRQFPVDCSPIGSHGPYGATMNTVNKEGMCNGMTLLSLGENEPLTLSLIGATTVRWVAANSTFANPYLEIDRSTRQGFVFAKASDDRVQVFNGENNQEMRPLVHLYPMETKVFATYYTMLIPEGVQKDFFGKRFEKLRFYDKKNLTARYGYALVRKSADEVEFDLRDAIDDRWILWRDYLDLATTIKEARTLSPEVIDYEVSVDLALFCKYGRPFKDLQSK